MRNKSIAATLCYLKKGNRTLMLLRNKKKNDIHEGKYNGLGGKMESGETPFECVKREVFEESGLVIKKPVFKGILFFPKFDGENDWIVFVFVARKFTGKLKKCSEGELLWVKDDRLLSLNLWQGDRIFLKRLNHKSLFSAVFRYRCGRLVSWKIESLK